jgi:hypothetical protein
MPRVINTNCSFCNLRGHTIRHCNSDEGNDFFNHIKSKSIDYLVMGNRETSLFTKSTSFYYYLMTYNMKELRFILSKRGDSINGTKTMLASRYVYCYFISELALEQFPDILSYFDKYNSFEYLNYWRNISQGVSIQEANNQLNDYFEFIDSMNVFDSDLDYDNISTVSKFPIHVAMEDNSTKPLDFECAICMQEDCCVSNQITIQCNHSFCKDCVTQYMIKCQESNKFPCCALCRGDFMDIKVNNIDVLEEFQDRFCV